jgi:hypothetical protein
MRYTERLADAGIEPTVAAASVDTQNRPLMDS